MKYKECLNQEVIVNELTHIQIMDFELSFGKLAIDGLHFLSSEKHCTIYESILKSETRFSRSLRIYSDVKSYGKNKSVGQFDLSSYFMDKDFDFRRKQLGIEECVKLMYIKITVSHSEGCDLLRE
ncbi:hypothetical protein MNBD_BACTEROID03-296 [hydrothermal vent metagenome]|uniref:Uncharacterized protein n=1 Tax=hydrothermal vent metagenome TaxID=652676 RepID=A0A3B0TSE7_9ZZZZ